MSMRQPSNEIGKLRVRNNSSMSFEPCKSRTASKLCASRSEDARALLLRQRNEIRRPPPLFFGPACMAKGRCSLLPWIDIRTLICQSCQLYPRYSVKHRPISILLTHFRATATFGLDITRWRLSRDTLGSIPPIGRSASIFWVAYSSQLLRT